MTVSPKTSSPHTAQAPTRTVTAGGVTYAYRELGPKGGIPVVFFVHLAATLDNWDPRIIDPIAQHTTSSPSTTAASEPPPAPSPTPSSRWPTTPTPSSPRSVSPPSTSSPSPSAGWSPRRWCSNTPNLVRKLILTGTGPAGGAGHRQGGRDNLLRHAACDPHPQGPQGVPVLQPRRRSANEPHAPSSNVSKERTEDRDAKISVKAFQTQLKAIKRWGRATPADLSRITQPTLIANGDNDRMVPSVLSEDMHRRIAGSQLIIYPDSGHGGIFQYHDEFAAAAIEFLDR